MNDDFFHITEKKCRGLINYSYFIEQFFLVRVSFYMIDYIYFFFLRIVSFINFSENLETRIV